MREAGTQKDGSTGPQEGPAKDVRPYGRKDPRTGGRNPTGRETQVPKRTIPR